MPKDLLIQANGSPEIKNGDFVIGESTLQHQSSLLKMHPGENKRLPLIGVGLSGFLESEELRTLPGRVSEQFELDGMQVLSCEISEAGNLLVKANYNNE
jgi:hypothetical protein